MPDARLQRTRESLPEGYQFGDGHPRQMRFFTTHGVWERDAIRRTTFRREPTFRWPSFEAAMKEARAQ